MDIRITENNIHIEDSYLVHKRDIKGVLEVVMQYALDMDSRVVARSRHSLALEWYAHNFLYALHIQRHRTKDVDLNYPTSCKERIFYAICGVIGWLFIR